MLDEHDVATLLGPLDLRQEVVESDVLSSREIWNETRNKAGDAQTTLFLQLKDRRSCEGFRDRSDMEARAW